MNVLINSAAQQLANICLCVADINRFGKDLSVRVSYDRYRRVTNRKKHPYEHLLR